MKTYDPSEHVHLFTSRHDVTFQRTWIFSSTTCDNPKSRYLFVHYLLSPILSSLHDSFCVMSSITLNLPHVQSSRTLDTNRTEHLFQTLRLELRTWREYQNKSFRPKKCYKPHQRTVLISRLYTKSFRFFGTNQQITARLKHNSTWNF